MKKSIRVIIGISVGALLGFVYYRFIGCNGGACPITSSPLNTVVYVGLMGLLLTV